MKGRGMALRKGFVAMMLAAGAALCGCGHDRPSAGLGSAYGLYYNDQGSAASLAYGLANSDDVALMLQCDKGKGRVEVSDIVRTRPAPRLVLTSAGRSTAVAVKVGQGESDGPRVLTGQTPLDAPALAAFRSTGRIEVLNGDVRYRLKASDAERAAVEQFFTACGRA